MFSFNSSFSSYDLYQWFEKNTWILLCKKTNLLRPPPKLFWWVLSFPILTNSSKKHAFHRSAAISSPLRGGSRESSRRCIRLSAAAWSLVNTWCRSRAVLFTGGDGGENVEKGYGLRSKKWWFLYRSPSQKVTQGHAKVIFTRAWRVAVAVLSTKTGGFFAWEGLLGGGASGHIHGRGAKKDPWPEWIRGGAAKHDDIECCSITFIRFQELELEWMPVISVATELKARIW